MMPPVAEVLAKAKSVFAFQTTDIIDHLASLLIERGAFVSGCGGSRTRRNSWLSQWTNSNTSCDSFPDYRSANQAWGGRTDALLLTAKVSGFRDRTNPDRQNENCPKDDQRLPKRSSSLATAFLAAVPQEPVWRPASWSFRRSKSESL